MTSTARGSGSRVRGRSAASTLLVLASSVALVAGLFAGAAPASLGDAEADAGLVPGWYTPGRVIVRFREDTSVASMDQAHVAVGATVIETFRSVPNLHGVALQPGVTVAGAIAEYRARPAVLYAQPDLVYRLDDAHLTPNDPMYPGMYNLNNTGQTGGTADSDIDAPEAWNVTTGSTTVYVGSLDTGVDYNHEDLAAHTRFNSAECNGTAGVDDEGNGYVDDCHGIDAFNGDSDPMDDHDHGTHTSGTIGAIGNNGIGVTGVNWNVQIVACKSHNLLGAGTSLALLECLQYMETMKAMGFDIVATNNSYGGCPEACAYDQALEDAIRSNMGKGILFVASAGNDGTDNDVIAKYPTNYFVPNVISVAATDHDDALASFSEFGRRSVLVGAPGVDVLSTVIGGYGMFSGTSMSSPHVVGIAALLKAQKPNRNWKAIKNLILAGGDPVGSLATTSATGRRVNANGSLTCSGIRDRGALRPLDTVGGSPITVAAFNIRCARSARGAMSVTITPGNVVVPLVDDGQGADEVPRDGIFTGSWAPAPCTPGSYTFTYSFGQVTTSLVTC